MVSRIPLTPSAPPSAPSAPPPPRPPPPKTHTRAPARVRPQNGAWEPLGVEWADPELQAKKRRAVGETDAEQRTVGARERGRAWDATGLEAGRGQGERPGAAAARPLQMARLAGRPAAATRAHLRFQALFATRARCCPQVFFAKVPRRAGEGDVRAVFSQYGRVCELKLFRAFQVRVFREGIRDLVCTFK